MVNDATMLVLNSYSTADIYDSRRLLFGFASFFSQLSWCPTKECVLVLCAERAHWNTKYIEIDTWLLLVAACSDFAISFYIALSSWSLYL